MRIQINTTNPNNLSRSTVVDFKAGQPVIKHLVLPGQKITVIVDGVIWKGSQLLGAKKLKLNKSEENLIIETEDGNEQIIELTDFYGQEDALLTGEEWSMADGSQLKNVNDGVMFVAEDASAVTGSALVGLGGGAAGGILATGAAVGLAATGGETQENARPVLSLSTPVSPLENAAAAGQTILTATATDADGETLTYSLVAGSNPDGYYAINATTGVVTLTAAGAAHVNAGNDLPAVQVSVSDGTATDTETATISATTDVNDAPVLALTTPTAPQENAATAGDVMTTATATDEEGHLMLFSLVTGSNPNGYYAIDLFTGVVTLTAAGAAHVHAGNDLPAVQVRVIDAFNAIDTESVTVPVTVDVNDAPVASPATITPTEDTPLAVPLAATDVDGTIASFTLTAGPTPAQGTLVYDHDGAPGTSAVAVTLDSPLTPAQAATVQFVPTLNYNGAVAPISFFATDNQGLNSAPATVTINNVIAVNDAPVLSLSTPVAPSENAAAADDVITTATATDEEGDTLTYSLVAGSNPNDYYAINVTTPGVVTLTAAGAAHVNAGNDLPAVQVSVTDGTATDTETATVPATTLVNDAPVLGSNLISGHAGLYPSSGPSAGVALSALMPTATDEDIGDTLVGYAVTSAAPESSNSGVWQYQAAGTSTWTALSGASDTNAIFLAADTKVRWSIGTTSVFPTTELRIVAVDSSAGVPTTGDVLDASVTGGSSRFSDPATLPMTSPPVVIDLNRDGSLGYSQVVMDVNGDGRLDQTAWADAQDGVLVWDKYADGLVRDSSQYAFTQFGGNTDLEGLAMGFDSNDDGKFNALDAKFGEFKVWQDADQDGVSDAGEVRSLADWGLTEINLTSDGVVRTPAPGVREAGQTTATATDGTSVLVGDVAFAYSSLAYSAQVGSNGTQLALLGAGMDLDFSSFVAVHGQVSAIDLNGTGTNSLKLSLSDVLSQPAASGPAVLMVDGGSDDRLTLTQTEGWQQMGTSVAAGAAYSVWEHTGTAHQVWIDQQFQVISA